jgi:hypothetical protein
METKNIDWLWLLWAFLYSGGFFSFCLRNPIENAWPIFFLGLMALAALKYLIRFEG